MNIDIKKWNPWNWFKQEEKEEAANVPVTRAGQERDSTLPSLFGNDPLWNIHREIDRLFNNVFSQFNTGLPRLFERVASVDRLSGTMLKPSVDIKESKKDYKITVEVPGVEENDVKIELASGTLTISGEKKYEKEEKDEHYHSIERSYGSFRRVLSLPKDADEDGIEARFRNGVLTVTVPRRETVESKDKPKLIEVKKAV
jgi:HSP20 family protein